MRYLLANIFVPDGFWNIDNLAMVIPDIHQESPKNEIKIYPRIIKSHFPYGEIPYKKVIYLFRDGRDVAVSYFHFLEKLQGYKKSFSVFFGEFLEGDLPFGKWHTHVNSMMLGENYLDILPVGYENLFKQTKVEISRIGDFLGYTWGSELIEDAIRKSSFSKVKQDYKEYKNMSHWSKGFYGGVRGGPGKWKDVITAKQNIRFWEVAGETAMALGYKKDG